MYIIYVNMMSMFTILFFLGCTSAVGLSLLASRQIGDGVDEVENSVWGSEETEIRLAYLVNIQSEDAVVRQNITTSIDQASLKVVSKLQTKLHLALQSDICWKCPLVKLKKAVISQDTNVTVAVDTRWPVRIAIIEKNSNEKQICEVKTHFGEDGEYMLMVDGFGGNYTCNLFPIKEPIDSYIPIYVALGIAGFLVLLATFFNCLGRRGYLTTVLFWKETENIVNSDLGSPTNVTPDDKEAPQQIPLPAPRKERLKSLDTFRGLSLVIMIFANYRGGQYWFFNHSPWYGLTVADLVFPWFVFIMGTSIAIALRSQLRRGVTRKRIMIKVLKRTAILFFLGLVVSNQGRKGAIDLEKLRIPGVLQRLAVSYFVVASLEVLFAKVDNPYEHSKWARIADIVPYLPEWFVALTAVAVHLCLTFLLPVPGCPTGYLGPGGLHDNGTHFNCTGGAAGHIDRILFGVNHLYPHPSSEKVYVSTVHFDPEGALGTLTSIFMCFLGLQAGKILTTYKDWVQRVHRWIFWGILTGIIAGGLCKFSTTNGVIPVCKHLWSLSFVLTLSSMAYFLLAVLYIVIDVYNFWSGMPFFYPGMNSIVVYLCSELLHNWFPIDIKVPSTHSAQLAIDIYGTSVWVILSVVLYHKGIFVAI